MYTRMHFEEKKGKQISNQQGTRIPLSLERLKRENQEFKGKGGVSQENRHMGFVPAYLDSASGKIYRSQYADGRPAPIHLLDGLPSHLKVISCVKGKRSSLSENLVSGFLRCGIFYTRSEAAEAMQNTLCAGD